MTIDSRGRMLWNTTGDDVGLTVTEVIVTDPGGMSTIVPLRVNVFADSSAPRLELQVVSGDQVLTGEEVVIRLGTPVRSSAGERQRRSRGANVDPRRPVVAPG